jgi:hypothetical protein
MPEGESRLRRQPFPRRLALPPVFRARRQVLESDVRRDVDAPESSGVAPGFAKGAGCRCAAGAEACRVLVIDVQSRHAENLVVEEVQGIAAQGQAHAFMEFEGFLDARVDLVERFCASDVAADRAGEGVPAAECVDRECVVDDEMDGGWTD